MIDTYENDRSIPSHDFITRVANHFNLSLDILTAKDLKLNPGYIIQGGELQRQEATKDEIIKMLKKQVRDLQTTVDQQNRIIEKLASK